MDLERPTRRAVTLCVSAAFASALQFLTRDSVGLVAWSWVLIGFQLLGLWSLSRQRPSGWLVGAVVQTGWTTYGVLTAQFAFVAGCTVSLAIQSSAWLRRSTSAEEEEPA